LTTVLATAFGAIFTALPAAGTEADATGSDLCLIAAGLTAGTLVAALAVVCSCFVEGVAAGDLAADFGFSAAGDDFFAELIAFSIPYQKGKNYT
jgi:hypothetical protein